jgi:MoxR-like ATPase
VTVTTPETLCAHLERQLFGKGFALRAALAAWLADGHVLIEDLPGVGKTTLAKTLAAAFGFSWRRLQGTPDLLPADITGGLVWDAAQGQLRFVPGPIFTEVLLCDELNRANPKSQSALLEAMEERQVTIEGESHPLPDPFLLIATQNPLSQIGANPLPEGQLDRFAVRLSLGYPPREAERALIAAALAGRENSARRRATGGDPAPPPPPLATRETFFAWRRAVGEVTVREPLIDYALELAAASRRHPLLRLGLSPRAVIQLVELSRAWAFLNGRDYLLPDDLQAIFPAATAHRLWVKAQAGVAAERVAAQLLAETPVPR